MRNSALSIRIGLRTPLSGGAIREVKEELRRKSTDFVKTEEIGRRFLGFKDALRTESTDLAKVANTGRHRPRSDGGIPPCAQGFG